MPRFSHCKYGLYTEIRWSEKWVRREESESADAQLIGEREASVKALRRPTRSRIVSLALWLFFQRQSRARRSIQQARGPSPTSCSSAQCADTCCSSYKSSADARLRPSSLYLLDIPLVEHKIATDRQASERVCARYGAWAASLCNCTCDTPCVAFPFPAIAICIADIYT